ncbi:MAG: hypothetical protein AB7G36_10040 [Candidatus Nanopelagicales bacterium]
MSRGSRVKTGTKGRACTGKRRFETRAGAADVLARMRRQKHAGPLMGVYACRHCGGFHLGHKRTNARSSS